MDPENPTPLEESLMFHYRTFSELLNNKNVPNIQQNSNSSPFGTSVDLVFRIPVIFKHAARAEVSLEFNKEPAMVVDLTNTGGIDTHSILKQSASQKRNDFIKDEYLNISSDSQSVHTILHMIILNMNKFNVSLEVEWIPRAENEIADYISRIIDTDDWGVAVHVFEYLDSLWGPHEIDWFASDHNHRLPVFYSRYWNVHSMGIDAFTVNWQGINGWYVPPVCLLLKVLMYMQQCNAYGTVILPLWRSANYWPFCVPKVFRNDITELPNDLDSYLAIIPDLLAQSKSDNTVKKYYWFLRWKKWAEINHISDVDILPTKPLYLALYLASLVQFSATSSPVCDAFYSIKWAHSIISADSPTDSQLVKCVFEGAKRKLGSQIKKKEPITPELLQAIIGVMSTLMGCLYQENDERTYLDERTY
ncbi:unnamed protein product [Mytilus edulis]|uniref:RNase H type-1 domain-containing protein n=1 Tax=Mytilus edulis TaxID=6550 RepID=A0A8S3URE4_MYTED|nr:unnamed protein product [Mytilus edulis]